MKTRSQIGRAARRKGADFERWLVRYLSVDLPPGFVVRRRLQSRGGWHEPDVGVFREGLPRALWHIECKCGAAPSMKKAIEQARTQADPCAMVAVVVKNTRKHQTQCVALYNERLTENVITLDELREEIRRWLVLE